ncbi:serine/threonine-protein kinase bud32 [Pseudogymnoascus verrucosus]|uniref:EKC/KEOPS complex subunit BUD32 n=1 Tax=Pseudogymnoascus verrucosus TaxID=342668 RepID=A0A1B8GYE6_9PEZI|nr:serine/threonine-protein kinase bud32 [Pseudogymnoascus verrucosus]OBU00849.2 serine/threonine-protein kinase bud32 [Pseudogymnoascus verrucosus]
MNTNTTTNSQPTTSSSPPAMATSEVLPPPTAASEPIIPLPTILTHPSSTTPQLITQGAEALLYKSTYLLPTLPCALKHRPPKPFRHPILDARLTKHRILSEARVLAKCRRDGVPVPAVYALDAELKGGWIAMEWVEGDVVRVALNRWLKRRKGEGKTLDDKEGQERVLRLMTMVGAAVGTMHSVGVVHGDLTTSNLMLRPTEKEGANGAVEDDLEGEIVLIDFGLASQSAQDEDRAVDLYVLERAFGSTHPGTEALFGEVLRAYGESFNGAKVTLKKLEDVRMRGRKRSMLG